MRKKIGADECDATIALIFFLTTLVKVSLPVLFWFLQFFVTRLLEKGIQIAETLTCVRTLRTTVLEIHVFCRKLLEARFYPVSGRVFAVSSFEEHQRFLTRVSVTY